MLVQNEIANRDEKENNTQQTNSINQKAKAGSSSHSRNICVPKCVKEKSQTPRAFVLALDLYNLHLLSFLLLLKNKFASHLC